MEINLVQKLIETMAQQTRAVIKAKGDPTKYRVTHSIKNRVCDLFFEGNFFLGQAVYIASSTFVFNPYGLF